MSKVEVLPGTLVTTPPGPVLGPALAVMDPSRYSSEHVFTMVALQAKQVAFEQARLLSMMLEAAYAYGGDVARVKAAAARAKDEQELKDRQDNAEGGKDHDESGRDSVEHADAVANGGATGTGTGTGEVADVETDAEADIDGDVLARVRELDEFFG